MSKPIDHYKAIVHHSDGFLQAGAATGTVAPTTMTLVQRARRTALDSIEKITASNERFQSIGISGYDSIESILDRLLAMFGGCTVSCFILPQRLGDVGTPRKFKDGEGPVLLNDFGTEYKGVPLMFSDSSTWITLMGDGMSVSAIPRSSEPHASDVEAELYERTVIESIARAYDAEKAK